MGVLNNSWLLLVAIIYGAYIAAILLVVFGVVAFIRAVRRWGQRGSGVCTICGIVTVICGIGSGAAMHGFLAGRYIIVPLIAGIVFLCIEAWVRSGDKVCNQTGGVNAADREAEQKKIEQTVSEPAAAKQTTVSADSAPAEDEKRTTLSLSLTVSDKKALKMMAAERETTIAAIIHEWVAEHREDK